MLVSPNPVPYRWWNVAHHQQTQKLLNSWCDSHEGIANMICASILVFVGDPLQQHINEPLLVVKNKQFHNSRICIGCDDPLQQHINEPLGQAILVSVQFYFIFQKLRHCFFFKEGDKCIIVVLFLHITPFSLGVWTFV